MYAAVGAGAALGGVLRAAVSLAVAALGAEGFPWATLAVNIGGSFLIGYFAAFTGPDGRLLVGPRQRQFVMTGFCGGFTTFSVFSLETLDYLAAGAHDLAATYAGLSLVTWFAAVWAGFTLAMRRNRLPRSKGRPGRTG